MSLTLKEQRRIRLGSTIPRAQDSSTTMLTQCPGNRVRYRRALLCPLNVR